MAKQQRQERERQDPNSLVNALGGIHTDNSLVNQPQGTTRYVFAGVNESQEGDLNKISNEEANSPCYPVPDKCTPIGKVYIGEENQMLFFAKEGGHSLIAILDKECALTVIVDDENQEEKLGFSVAHQIDATFRLRRGCERTVYWVDPKPRSIVIDKLEDYINQDTGEWEISNFALVKGYKSIPAVESIVTVEGGGKLPPGSYNFAIRYLDSDFNPTEFITSTETISIYNSILSAGYKSIRGSTLEQNAYLDYENTNKAIRITFNIDSLDKTYPFYQLAIIESNSGTGLITDTKLTAEISTEQPVFNYTGSNYQSSITLEEVTAFSTDIGTAESIEQIENTLILGSITGKQVDFCKLQKYASLIGTDVVTKDIFLSILDEGNSKDPSAHFNGIGYMPGEIYAWGIDYIFEDNYISPVFHIPGKSPLVEVGTMYSTGENVFPMSNVNNSCTSTRYTENNNCNEDTFWGLDIEGNELKNKPVRHHRFPLRTDYNIPFVEEVDVTEETEEVFVRNIQLKAYKENAVVPLLCDEEDCLPASETDADFGDPVSQGAFQVEMEYLEDTTSQVFSTLIDPLQYAGEVGGTATANVLYISMTGNIYTPIVSVVSLKEIFEGSTNTVSLVLGVNPITSLPEYIGTSVVTGLVYTLTVGIAGLGSGEKLYKAPIFGVKFSNIIMPSLEATGGNKIIGYNIVRLERKEEDKTILDSAVLLPTVKEKNFVAQGLLSPEYVTTAEENNKIKKDVLGFISPEHKFNNKKYSSFSNIIQQGRFKTEETIKSRIKIHDVAPGSGYVAGKHKRGESDIDGFCLHVKTRDTFFSYESKYDFDITADKVKEVFYLDALEEKSTTDHLDTKVSVFNLACDNKIGMLSLEENYTFNNTSYLNYVYLTRDNLEPYSNFRIDPYYKENKNPIYFTDDLTSEVEVFNGDSYITSIKYVNSIYYDTRMKKRAGKTNAFSYVLAAVLVIVAVAVTIFSAGTGSIIGAALVGAAAGLVGGATALILSGVKQDAWNKAYYTLYNQGLRNTITDEYLRRDVDPVSGWDRGNLKNPHDDEIQWLGDAVNLWFESGVNMGIRHGATDATPDFLDSPSSIQQGTTYPENEYEYFGIYSVWSGGKKIEGGSRQEDIVPTNPLDFHMYNKLTYFDAEKKSSRSYVGLALAEMYLLNPDYVRRNKQKAYNALGPEYDCCSDCLETFTHRWHWSEQAFQEELTDNFRLFLPNNYKDLEAETGPITDIFRIQNNLYIHTTEGLWHCPQTFQERVTSNIISFIGTGEYFSIPPRKMVDDNNSSAGNRHKWARLKTKYGVLFPSGKELKWYLFNGEKLDPISDQGNATYFRNNMKFAVEEQYYQENSLPYPYSNNPSNPLGVGFLSTYDTSKERLIITKKDFSLNLPVTQNYEICSEGGTPVIFEDIPSIVEQEALDGWNYLGIENCKLKFERTKYQEEFITVNRFTTVPSDLKIYYFMDTSGSFEPADFTQIEESLFAWLEEYIEPTGWVRAGNLFRKDNDTEKWLTFPDQVPLAHRNNVLLISFCNEAQGGGTGPEYHGLSMNFSGQPTAKYITDYNNYVGALQNSFGTFIGINYPIATINTSKAFILHSLAAIKGRDYTLAEVNAIPVNNYFSTAEWTSLKSLLLNNPYSSLVDLMTQPGLEQFGWKIKPDRSNVGSPATGDCEASSLIISPCQFALDMNEFLSPVLGIEEIVVPILVPVTEVKYIAGVEFEPIKIDYSWTMSYSLKKGEWIGWHPYLPDFYFHQQEKFYSWKQGLSEIWKHNTKGAYQTFYGVYYPFIIEYVDNPNPLLTKIWEMLLFQTEAKKEIGGEYLDLRDVTFNKALFYNTEQISGVLNLLFKDPEDENYLMQQTQNTVSNAETILLDRNERDWTINDLRNYRVDYTVPMFQKVYSANAPDYHVTKQVNPLAISFNKDWRELDSFRDKFLVVRLIFDTFADVKLSFDFSSLDKKPSER